MCHTQHQADANGIIARCGIITLSDTRTPEQDTSGQAIRSTLQKAGHFVVEYALIRNEPDVLYQLLFDWLSRSDIDFVITNGGTGISRRDNTIPVIERMIESPLPGFGELFRVLGYQQIGSSAMLSRATAGTRRGKMIFALPGSTRAVELAMTQLIIPEIKHLIRELRR